MDMRWSSFSECRLRPGGLCRRAFLALVPGAVALRGQSPVFDARRAGGIQKAIDSAAAAGGGTVYVTAGRLVIGTVRLRSNVSLWLDNGAVLAMDPNPAAFDAPEILGYDPHADRSTAYFHNGMIVGDGLENVAIYGQGTIDGNRERGGGPKPISLKRCRNVAIHGITIRNAPNYNISLLGCEHVEIDGVTIRNGFSDGIDPDCCKFVRISNCFVESVDDAICLKASPSLGERVSTEHVTIANCVLRTASIHVKCGTESYGDFRNVAISNCAFVGGMGDRHGNPGLALYSVDGGNLDGVTVSNLTMQNVGVPIALRLGARGRGQESPRPGTLRNVQIANIVATGARRPSVICGIPAAAIDGVGLSDIRVTMAQAEAGPESLASVPEKIADYPDPTMFGPLPAAGLYIRHAADLEIRNCHFQAANEEQRAGVVADNAEQLRFTAVRSRLWLNDVRGGSVVDSGPEIRITGPRSTGIERPAR